MEIKKVNLDRTKLTSSYIQEKQDFDKVLKNSRLTKTPTFKSPWFYGAVGLSSVAVATMMLTDFDKKIEKNEKNATHLNVESGIKKGTVVMASVLPMESIEPQKKEEQKKRNSFSGAVKSETRIEAEKKPKGEIVNDVVQVAEPVKTQPKYRSEFPTINRLSSGKLSVSDLLNAEGIEINEEYKIVSYNVLFFNGARDLSVQISGNVLPQNIKEQISKYNVGQMVFFTDIKGLTSDGRVKNLPSMNFKIVPN
jgi:hypothetical protein